MALQDQIIKRLQAKGVEVADLRGVLPRNGRWLGRPVSAIKQIAGHWDAEHRPHAYDSVQRYIGQANYHINKDWAPPGQVHGDGLMYAWKIDNVGMVFVTRDLEDVLWSVGDQNYVTASYCFDGTTGEGCTREQIESEQQLLEVLCFGCPEFPASQRNVLGHQEVPGNSTACPGDFLPSIRSYRAEGQTHPELYAYENQPAAQAPPPPPASAPEPVIPPVEAPPTQQPPIVPPVPEPLPEPSAPQAPTPGTIIQPEPGRGGSEPSGQPTGDIPVKATPTPIVTSPDAMEDQFEPFTPPRTLMLLADAYAIDLHAARPPKGPFEAGTPIVGITGVLTQASNGRRYYVGHNYAIPAEAFEDEPADPEPVAVPSVPPTLGELLRAISHLVNAIHEWLTKPRSLKK